MLAELSSSRISAALSLEAAGYALNLLLGCRGGDTTRTIATRRRWPADTFTDNSRLYSPAMVRLRAFKRLEMALLSFSNCLRAIMDRDLSSFAWILVMRSLIRVRKPSPPAHVVHQHSIEIRRP